MLKYYYKDALVKNHSFYRHGSLQSSNSKGLIAEQLLAEMAGKSENGVEKGQDKGYALSEILQ